MAEITEYEDATERTLAQIDRIMDRTVRTAALAIIDRAQKLVPVDTGWLANSLYVYAEGEDGEKPGLPAAERFSEKRNKKVHQPAQYAEEEAMEIPAHGGAVEVRVAASYGVYLEDGTVHMAAQPFLGPAADEVFGFIDRIAADEAAREGL